jgi:Meiotically up-regulated gene 113
MIGDHLYIIGEPGSQIAKVGHSDDVRRRLKDLTIGSPAQLAIHHVEPGLGPCERLVHSALADRRLHGEWFDFGSENPRQVVRAALLSLDELAWLEGLRAAVEEAASEQGKAHLARARELLQHALDV